MKTWFARGLTAFAFVAGFAIAAAQDAPPPDLPELKLNADQKQTIYQSITNQQDKKSTAPEGFRAAVGANVPDSVKLTPMPKTIIELMPETKDYEVGLVANQVLI